MKLGLALMLAMGTAAAHDYQVGELKIAHPWTRATPPAAKMGGVFLSVNNLSKEGDTLLKAESEVAEQAELHQMSMVDGVMKMRQVPSINVPASGEVKLAPGGLHIMLINLKQALKEGEKIPLKLTFAKAGTVEVKVRVEAMGSQGVAPGAAH
ncbi:copper chaperone PCu(A)C [Chitinibacter bivalviorum]|uniref:Copper chaperone PCu(A)C n=1 Tax=Chitinibacter bivalviorum TaxID=2739434 RepID=A0A7H9BFK5_9NEIS|nr:copper chaperone PCu(A)C [Chitinibacter bivalviorum]QLG87490.1 copper chaperone PCu(A)C [Chitinibacter bivalviorum]